MTDPILKRPPGRHPSLEELRRAYLDPEAPDAEGILDHAALCAECSEELLHLEAFEQPEALPAERLEAAWKKFGPPAPRRIPSRRPLWALAAAAAVSLLAAGIWQANNHPPAVARPQPPQQGDGVRGDGALAGTWSPIGPLAEAPREFRFPAEAGPQNVMVFGPGNYRWTSEPIAGGRVAYPEAERQKLKPGEEYYWTVLGERDTAARKFTIRGR
jgi:hypothetical protein